MLTADGQCNRSDEYNNGTVITLGYIMSEDLDKLFAVV